MISDKLLNGFLLIAVASCLGGLIWRLAPLWWIPRSPFRGAAAWAIDAPSPRSFARSVLGLATKSGLRCHGSSDPVWLVGCLSYHLAILLVVSTYAASAAALFSRAMSDLPSFWIETQGGSPAAIAGMIFGSAEAARSAVLFGERAPWYRAVTFCELPLAVAGNLSLLYTVARRRLPASVHGRSWAERLVVRLIILAIIWTEFAGRFEWLPLAAKWHVMLAAILVAAAPFTYLNHAPLAPLAIWSAIRRRRRHAFA